MNLSQRIGQASCHGDTKGHNQSTCWDAAGMMIPCLSSSCSHEIIGEMKLSSDYLEVCLAAVVTCKWRVIMCWQREQVSARQPIDLAAVKILRFLLDLHVFLPGSCLPQIILKNWCNECQWLKQQGRFQQPWCRAFTLLPGDGEHVLVDVGSIHDHAILW